MPEIILGLVLLAFTTLGYVLWRQDNLRNKESLAWYARVKPLADTIHVCPRCSAPESDLFCSMYETKPFLDLSCLACGHRWAVSTRP